MALDHCGPPFSTTSFYDCRISSCLASAISYPVVDSLVGGESRDRRARRCLGRLLRWCPPRVGRVVSAKFPGTVCLLLAPHPVRRDRRVVLCALAVRPAWGGGLPLEGCWRAAWWSELRGRMGRSMREAAIPRGGLILCGERPIGARVLRWPCTRGSSPDYKDVLRAIGRGENRYVVIFVLLDALHPRTQIVPTHPARAGLTPTFGSDRHCSSLHGPPHMHANRGTSCTSTICSEKNGCGTL